LTEAQPRFEELYRRHAASAFRRARRLLGSEADAHEIVHDVFVSLFERPEQYAGNSGLSTFLYSAVTHACLNKLRNHRNRERLLREHWSVPALPELFGASAERIAELHWALERMPERLAHAAIYYYLDELPHRDIARIMGCSGRHVGDLLERVAIWARQQESATCSS
jgi:RNA polymerase sigma factor (sigma-70 family)